MFKKLKEKITEEVKISPQRFQQLTQSVSDKLQGTSAPDDNMFSIGEEDEHSSTRSPDQGFSSVTLVSPSSESRSRRVSTSSIASDVSFFPKYEPGNLYHLQSDLDVSASELEDNVSQSSSQLGHLSKEHVYAAFQKAQMRYHKYRGRYTDLARHYKEMERENAKMKSVLVETQDKAIRRINELKEQCALEQKAKAHLESALRDELDEKQMKIQSLETKIDLVHQGQENVNSLVDIDKGEMSGGADPGKLEQLTKYLNDARLEIESLNNKMQEYKANAIVFQSKEQDYKNKIAALEKDIASFSEREKENNIKLAENKMELHNELLSKDTEINKLKKEVEHFRANASSQERDSKSTKIENLQSQNNKLIEKLENLTQKCNGLDNELLKVEKYKIDIQELSQNNERLSQENIRLQANVDDLKSNLRDCEDRLKSLTEDNQKILETAQQEKVEYEKRIEDLRDSAKKGFLSLESQISEKIAKHYEEKETELRDEFERQLKEALSNSQSSAELSIQLVEQNRIIKDLTADLEEVRNTSTEKIKQYMELESNHLELIEESNQLRSSLSKLEKLSETNGENMQVYEEKIGRLQANIKTLQEELNNLEKISQEKEEQIVKLSKENLKLGNNNQELLQKYRLMEEKNEAGELEITENNLLELKVEALEEENRALLESFEVERQLFNKISLEHKDLKIKEIQLAELEQRNQKLEEKIIKLKGYLNDKENSIVHLNKSKLALEQELQKARETIRIREEREEAIELDKTECNLLQIKVQQLENEKENLLKSFKKEQECLHEYFHSKSEEFECHKDDINKENVELAKENLELKSINKELLEKVRLFEEKDQAVELETTECNLLKLKVQELENQKNELLNSFEMERELFNKTLLEHKELKLKEEQLKDLKGSNDSLTEKVAKLKQYLKKKEETIVKLQKDLLAREQEVAKLHESLRIKQEQIDTLDVEKSECGILEMKVQKLEEEKRNLLESFELERAAFESALTKGAHIETKIDELQGQITALNSEKKDLSEAFNREKGDLISSFETERKQFHSIQNEVTKLSQENLLLKEEKDNLNSRLREEGDMFKGQIDVLKEEINRLQSINEKLRGELDDRQEKLDKLSGANAQIQKELQHIEEKNKTLTDSLNKEVTEKKEAIAKFKEIQEELIKNNCEINEIKNSLETVEKLYNEAKDKHSNDLTLLEAANQKVLELEKALAKKAEDYNSKVKESNVIEQQLIVITQEKANITQENKVIKEQLERLTTDCDNLRALTSNVKELEYAKKQNEALQKECDKLNSEISELKVRINQLASDNRNVNQEHDKLASELENYKVQCEFLANEKGSVENNCRELQREVESLRGALAEVTEKVLDKNDKSTSATANSEDLVQIKKDFLDIRDKCEKLHLENKNLKSEYVKLEEQCSSFSKVKKDLETQMAELERHYNESLHEKQLLLDEIHELKISPINALNTDNNLVKREISPLASSNGTTSNSSHLQSEIDHLNEKLMQYKSLDLTNKSSIEFYESELQKLKNKNEKLSRKLDETLVTLNHCTDLKSSTEIEYLRNVLYNYMLGKEGMVLARVIAAVCKFDSSQTEAVLQKEQQKQTLLGQLGLL